MIEVAIIIEVLLYSYSSEVMSHFPLPKSVPTLMKLLAIPPVRVLNLRIYIYLAFPRYWPQEKNTLSWCTLIAAICRASYEGEPQVAAGKLARDNAELIRGWARFSQRVSRQWSIPIDCLLWGRSTAQAPSSQVGRYRAELYSIIDGEGPSAGDGINFV